jgi:hypothetical protein
VKEQIKREHIGQNQKKKNSTFGQNIQKKKSWKNHFYWVND